MCLCALACMQPLVTCVSGKGLLVLCAKNFLLTTVSYRCVSVNVCISVFVVSISVCVCHCVYHCAFLSARLRLCVCVCAGLPVTFSRASQRRRCGHMTEKVRCPATLPSTNHMVGPRRGHDDTHHVQSDHAVELGHFLVVLCDTFP